MQFLLIKNYWKFIQTSFTSILAQDVGGAILYLDPPYINRNNNYVGGWNNKNERELHDAVQQNGNDFILSTWLSAKGETNPYIESVWGENSYCEIEHFYSVGQKSINRYAVKELLVWGTTHD